MTGLYIHVPFCARACPYCDFDFEVGRRPDVETYFEGLQREYLARSLDEGPRIQTLYVGGGTPTMLGEAGLRRLFDWLEARFDLSDVVESTLEANPEHLDAPLVDALASMGVCRLSVGLQTLDPPGLVQLGRGHDAHRGLAAVRASVAGGMRTSVDLIVGWPGQSQEILRRDLEGIINAGVEHVSIYGLTIEEGTPWPGLVRKGARRMPDPDAQAQALTTCEAMLVGAGFDHYEVASYARADAMARHNLGYWSWSDYVGMGPSAASATFGVRGDVTRRSNPRGLQAWSQDPGAAHEERLDPKAAALEGLWTGLRRLAGADVAAFLRRFLEVDRPWLQRRVARQVERGNLRFSADGSTLAVVPGRWLFHDEICADLMVG